MTMRDIACLGPNRTLGADDHQWILCREGKAVPFVRSMKAVLARCIREKGIELSPEGLAALDSLPDSFDAWRADPAATGTPIFAPLGRPVKKARLEAEASGLPPTPPTPSGPGEKRVGHKPEGITMIERLGPRCAIGADDWQWVVLRAVGQGVPGREGGSHNWQGQRWQAVGFIHSSRRALLACIEAKGLELSPAGRAAIARRDAKICRWRRATPIEAAA
jgi:hypothetical protein